MTTTNSIKNSIPYMVQPLSAGAVLSQSEELLTELESLNRRWMQHFQELLNRPSTKCNTTLNALEHGPVMEELATLPREEELKLAI